MKNLIRGRFALSIIALFTLISLVSSCKKAEEVPPVDATAKGELEIKFDQIVGSNDLVLNAPYTRTSGATFNVTTIKYFVSNIVLTNSSGGKYTVPQDSSYFLIDEQSPASTTIRLKNVPEGDYTAITYTVGVDSLRNTMDVSRRAGALDVSGLAQGMYWSWNSGYIFLKMEGNSPVSPTAPDGQKAFKFHIGGFGGYSTPTANNVRVITLPFGSDKASVRKVTQAPSLHITFDVMRVMEGDNINVDFTTQSTIMGGPNATKIADNYVKGFKLDHIH